MSDDKPIPEMSFEEALAELEAVVRSLEDGKVALDRSIDLYERGEALRKHCDERLRAAEMRVEKIVAQGERATGTEPFENG